MCVFFVNLSILDQKGKKGEDFYSAKTHEHQIFMNKSLYKDGTQNIKHVIDLYNQGKVELGQLIT